MHPFVLALCLLSANALETTAGLSQHEKLELRSVTPSAAQVPRYGRFEITLDLTATFDNPFDPDDIDVYAEFTSPDGKALRVNGFFTVSCSRRLDGDTEHIEPSGRPFWQIRFAPNREGTWRYRVFAKDRTGKVASPEAVLNVTPCLSPGFVRRNSRISHAFFLDNARPFFPIGENMCWGGHRGSFDYDTWLAELAQARGNWIRLWMCRWNCALEWTAEDKSPWRPDTFAGLGVYNLANAWKLDTILDTAEKHNVFVMLCLGTYGEFTTGGYFNEGMWSSNPYSAANGGPCVKPEDFWTSEQARKLYKRRLRYIAARYGWRSNIFAWEFWNEAHAPAAWVAEMAQFMKGSGPYEGNPADPYGHLVSTTYGNAETWGIPEIDFSQSHQYGEGNIPDLAPLIHDDARLHRKFEKPHLMAEFGIDWRSSDEKYDTGFQGINLHNAMWASVLSGNAGSAMIWYWDNYVHPGKLYHQFTPLRAFTDGIPWAEGQWKELEADPPRIDTGTETFRDLVIAPTGIWGRSPVREFTITPLGKSGDDSLPPFLYGPLKPELRTPLILHVDYAQPGRLELRVSNVSSAVRFGFLLDGALVREVALSANPPSAEGAAPEYESTEFRTEYGIYQARFNKSYGIDVPAGSHTITVDVTEGDWMSVADYAFGGYISSRFPRVNLYGITNGATAFLWAQNADHNWLNVRSNVAVAPIEGAKTAVHGLPAGSYICEWWDTWKGAVARQQTLVSADNTIPIELPTLDKDVAASIRPVSSP